MSEPIAQVLKFGGTSMGDEHTWRSILHIIRGYPAPAVVVSATANTTRQLLEAARNATQTISEAQHIRDTIRRRHEALVTNFIHHSGQAGTGDIQQPCIDWIDKCMQRLDEVLRQINSAKKLTPQLHDAAASIGEQLSSRLFAYCGQYLGMPTQWVDAGDIIITDDAFGHAQPQHGEIDKRISTLKQLLEEQKIPVMGGYYGQSTSGHRTTLGFEGSDYSASLIGAALHAQSVEIWTDVSGIYTTDPRVVSSAQPIGRLSYEQAATMAHFGARVLHPSTVAPAAQKQLPVFVKNIFEPNHPGTKIHYSTEKATLSHQPAKAVPFFSGCKAYRITPKSSLSKKGGVRSAEQLLNKLNCKYVLATVSSSSLLVICPPDEPEIDTELLRAHAAVSTVDNLSLITAIGLSSASIKHLQRPVFEAIGAAELLFMNYDREHGCLTLGVKGAAGPVVQKIHDALF